MIISFELTLDRLFLKMSKQGSNLAGIMDAFSIAVSIGLQYDELLCMTCGVKMRMAGSYFVREVCGNASGCS
jgi:hypothetical protein